MNTELFLGSIERNVVKEQRDFFLLRVSDNSVTYRLDLYDVNFATGLKALLLNRAVDVSKKDIQDWLESFRCSNEFCSVRAYSDQDGNICKLIIERVSGRPNIFIFGAGHVGQALALSSVLLGYDVVVVDDRAEFASRKRLPDTRIKLVVDDFDKAIRDLHIGPRSAAVIVTRGHQFDEICLDNLLRLQTGYLGMIGSKRRVLSIFKRLSHQGFTSDDLSRVHAPIGLSIGAKSPQEIAIAILAEIIAEANKVSLRE